MFTRENICYKKYLLQILNVLGRALLGLSLYFDLFCTTKPNISVILEAILFPTFSLLQLMLTSFAGVMTTTCYTSTEPPCFLC